MDANMKQALETVAATMSLEQRQIVGFQLKDLVSSCIMNGEPCDMVGYVCNCTLGNNLRRRYRQSTKLNLNLT